MAITIRYQINTQWASFFQMREFETQRAANHWLDNHLPKNASNIDIWVTESLNEPRQAPTWYTAPTSHHPWWDANKRPFADRYEREETK